MLKFKYREIRTFPSLLVFTPGDLTGETVLTIVSLIARRYAAQVKCWEAHGTVW